MITIEQIDEFRKRTNSSYEDAKYFLEKNDGDILDAIIEFERTKSGANRNYDNKKKKNDAGKKFADLLQKGFDNRIIFYDKDSTLFEFPVLLLILLIPLWIPAVLVFALLKLLNYKVTIKDVKNENVDVNAIFRNINEKAKESQFYKDSDKNNKEKAGTNRNANYNRNSNSDGYSNPNSNANFYGRSNPNSNTNPNGNANPYGYASPNSNAEPKQNSPEQNANIYQQVNYNQTANTYQNAGVVKSDISPVSVQNNVTLIPEVTPPIIDEEDDEEDGFNEYTIE